MEAYWGFTRSEMDVCTLFDEPEIGKRIAKDPRNPVAVRRVFHQVYADSSVPLILSGRYKQVPLGDSRWAIDVAFFGWIAAFSAGAHALLIAHGCNESDFVSCHFTLMPEQKFYMYLPQRHYDVVDMERSKFHMILPMDPPLPIGFGSLVLKSDTSQLPECFYAKVPGYEMVFSELLVSGSIRKEWNERGMTGAEFDKVKKFNMF